MDNVYIGVVISDLRQLRVGDVLQVSPPEDQYTVFLGFEHGSRDIVDEYCGHPYKTATDAILGIFLFPRDNRSSISSGYNAESCKLVKVAHITVPKRIFEYHDFKRLVGNI